VTVDWNQAWTTALDELEADVDRVEALLADDHRVRDLPPVDPWSPPAGLGPLPLDLRPRADAVLSRQIATAKALALAMVANRRQIEMTARLEVGEAHPRPSYLDTAV
jgi:hypothetical protein